MYKNIFLIILLISTIFINNTYAIEKAVQYVFKLKDGKLNAQINNLPLSEVLKELADTIPLEYRGYPVGNELVTLNFSNLTLEDTLKKILRGYNFVLIKPENSKKTIVMIVSKSGSPKDMESPATPTVEEDEAVPSISPQPSGGETPTPTPTDTEEPEGQEDETPQEEITPPSIPF